MGDGKCFAKKAPENGPPLFQHGDLVFQAHHVGWIVTGFFTAVATITSIWLVNKHLQWYTNKREQRYIVRLLFLVPIYAIVSFASYLFWDHATALILVRDCYESTVLTAFFYLLLMYLSPNPDEQKAIFLKKGLSRKADRAARKKGHKPGRWVFPLGFIKYKPEDGLYFLQLMKWGVLQYCVIRPITTLAAVLFNYFGLYCETSWSPVWGHIYIVLIVSVSVSVAMYCLIQLYVVVSKELAPRKPLLKLFAVKAVVFLTFWQATGLGMLSVLGVVKDSKYMTAEEINIGIGAILETFEMMLFAFLHIKAFTYKPYRPPTLPGDPPPGRTNQFRSLGHVFDFRETFREIWAGSIYIIDRMKGREPRPDRSVRRVAHMEKALGRVRPGFEVEMEVDSGKEKELADRDGEPGKVVMEGEAEDDVGERIWLGIGDDDRYGLGYGRRREKSEAFGEQVEKELRKRGYELGITGRLSAQIEDVEIGQEHRHQQQKSWWRSIYDRISQAGADSQRERLTPGPSRRKSRSQSIYRSTSHHHSRDHRPNHQSRDMDHVSLLQDDEYEDPPPGSVIKNYRHSKQWRESGGHGHRQSDTDVLAPLDVFDQHQSRNHRPHLQVVQRDLPPIPQSSQGSALAVPATQVSRCDSLLARVFPNATSLASSSDHGTESTTSRTHSTSRTRLMPPTPVVVKQVIAHHLPSGVGGAEDTQNSYAHFLSPEDTIHGVDYEDVPSQPSHRRLSAHTDIPLPPLPRREHTQALQSPPRERPHRRESAQTGPSPSPQGSPQMRLDVLQSSPPRMDSPHRKKTGHEVLSTPTSDVLRAAQRAHTALPSQPLRVSPHRTESAYSEQSSSHPRSSIPLDEHVADAYPHALASEFRQSDVQQSSGQSPYHGGSADTHSVASTALREQPPPLPFRVPPSPPVTASPLTSQPRGFTHQSVPSLRRISDVVSPPYIPPKRRTQKRLSTAPVHFSTPNQPVNYQSSQQGRIPQPRSNKRTSTPLEGSPFPIQMPRLSHSRPIHSLDISNTSIHLPTHSLSPGSSHRKFIPLSAAPPGVRATSQPSHSADFSGLPIPGLLDESPSFLRRSDSRYPSTGVINALQEDRIPGWDGIYS